MADPSVYRPKTSDIPTDPGVYRFIDEDDRVIYVGKAKNLRQRLVNYFQDLALLHPRTRQMVTTAGRVEWVVLKTEVEALTLEYSWIKEFDPRFNVMYRDDKSYPYLAVTMSESIPRAGITRNAHKKGNRYFGPYTQVWAIRHTLDSLLHTFPVRTCSPGVLKQAQRSGRPCLLGYIDKCSAPCVGRISEEDHRELALELCNFLDGDTGRHIRSRERDMKKAATELDFERAARLRDDVEALKRVVEQNAVVLPDRTDVDVFGLVSDELEASVQVFHVRGGRVRGQRGWVTERVENLDDAGLVTALLLQVYGEQGENRLLKPSREMPEGQARSVDDRTHTPTTAIPREIIVPVMPDDPDAILAWLEERRGARINLHVAQRGDKARLAETVHENATQALARAKVKRSGDLTQRAKALEDLRDVLGLSAAPLRIECFDVSHTQGTHQVASMVVFEDGIPRKADYRHYIIRGENGEGARDDTAAMDEVLRRRLAKVKEGSRDVDEEVAVSGAVDPDTGRVKKFAYRPNLIVVDGGLPQVNAAQRVVDELGVDVEVVGLAKRLEEVWIPGDDFPVIFPRSSAALHLLQHVRDESHRFAISHHRKRRSKAMTRSALDAIPGLGPARQKDLLDKFGSVAKIKQASPKSLPPPPGLGPPSHRRSTIISIRSLTGAVKLRTMTTKGVAMSCFLVVPYTPRNIGICRKGDFR
ncbi:excinuclease ABC subunit UvrC [Flaviflexus ciconiae]|uniref:UvrABC system protein C n=1 Tax=Flaviflexus ciconiae TaxID=2496867 RepID=A0A3S9PWA3_9ACTO|nr:excinuclease ABC subunit UvrC [Flaviflexus ciconiae]AZQ76614.1 excinuclease ABC subunit UvrC [Flaviflexus ciconiae]